MGRDGLRAWCATLRPTMGKKKMATACHTRKAHEIISIETSGATVLANAAQMWETAAAGETECGALPRNTLSGTCMAEATSKSACEVRVSAAMNCVAFWNWTAPSIRFELSSFANDLRCCDPRQLAWMARIFSPVGWRVGQEEERVAWKEA